MRQTPTEFAPTEFASRFSPDLSVFSPGVEPSAGIVVFNQIDKKKERSITKDALQELLAALKCEGKSVEEIMERLDTDEDGVRSSSLPRSVSRVVVSS